MTTTNAQKPFEPGERIDFCDEHYTVLQNYGQSGMVKAECGAVLQPFYWTFDGAECRRIDSV